MGFDPVLGTTTTTPYRIKAIQYPWRLEQRNKDNPERLKAWLSELYDKVNVFNALMMDIHGEGDGLTFLRRDKKSIPNPYKELALAMSKTFPDIVGVLPGAPVDEEVPWAQVGLVVEVKGANHLDPMDSESQRANADLVQITESALNLISAHGAQYAYILHDMGCFACIYRFDHASAVVSHRFNYIDEHEFISKFFYRLLRPSHSDQVVLNGQDDFSFVVSESFVKGLGIPGLIDEDLYWNRILTLPLAALDFLTLCPIHFSPRLFSRATGTPPSSRRKGKAPAKNDTWSLTPHEQARGDDADSPSMAVVEDSGVTDLLAKRTRVDGSMDSSTDRPEDNSSSAHDDLLGGFQVKRVKRVIIKEQYRQTERINEVVHYDKINPYLEKHNIPHYGLAKMLYGKDLGETFSFHVTVSATAKDPKNGPRNERSHMQIVLDIVGEPLSKFTSTKQLVRAIRDAIIGHLLVYLSGVLHRDVSFGNVMLVRNGVVEFCGFIDNLDYGSPVDSSKFRWKGSKGTPFQGKSLRGTPLSAGERKRFRELENELKERTGMVEFMAMELIDADPENNVPHQAHHDLESFFWLLVWVVLCHTNHDHKEGKGAFSKVFGTITPQDARERKEYMFLKKMFTIKDNAPLSYLLKRLRSMVFKAYAWEGEMAEDSAQTPAPLMYDAMLKAFDEALRMEGWPEDNAAIPFKPPYSETDGGMDIKMGAGAGIIGTSSRLRKERVESALPTGAGNAPSSPSEPQDAELTPTRPKHSTGRGGKAKSTRSQASGHGTKRKQPS
ncbi:hypothetical protein WOLCODRAFT_29424 [Wolfiporia cocos MD-104 SS10]|uniref:Fungal-type protein kinase domain-containing protein n=1 Tax=Wolfiporia cocos (strain MD-104) TaxID=742152 RepID=A0A2H3JK82_WOLCO|nr:hypothetical protein WOLCODRAFT_29424 [Wolfiporia cocos MD-104 SS10]